MRRKSRLDTKIIDGYIPDSFPGFLMAEEVKALVGTLRVSVEELIVQLLPKAAIRAIVPVSGFKVGAISRGVSGNLYFGANIEFIGEPLSSTVHAEQASIANAMAKGERGIKAITVNALPCGLCRQFLNELNTADELKFNLPEQQSIYLKDLLSHGFGPQNLNIHTCLMDHQIHAIELEKPATDDVTQKALQAAQSSYAPYSNCYAGVALEAKNGEIFTGAYIENAAYNPSLMPMQAAIANFTQTGKGYSEIVNAVLVSIKGKKVDLAGSSKRLLKSISSMPLNIVYGSISSQEA